MAFTDCSKAQVVWIHILSHHLLEVWLCASYLTSLCFSFFICNVEIKQYQHHKLFVKIKLVNISKVLRTMSGTGNVLDKWFLKQPHLTECNRFLWDQRSSIEANKNCIKFLFYYSNKKKKRNILNSLRNFWKMLGVQCPLSLPPALTHLC